MNEEKEKLLENWMNDCQNYPNSSAVPYVRKLIDAVREDQKEKDCIILDGYMWPQSRYREGASGLHNTAIKKAQKQILNQK